MTVTGNSAQRPLGCLRTPPQPTIHPGVFTTDFDENKKLVAEYSTVSTKHLRNKIAGYVTRLVRQQAVQA